MGCKVTKSIDGKNCAYAVAGLREVFLANYYPPVVGAASVAGKIAYTFNTDGLIASIKLPTGEVFYRLGASSGTAGFTDALLAGANGGMYRQHTLNAFVNQNDIAVLNQSEALSLGRFIAVTIDNAGIIKVLGRQNGIKAPAGGFDYASGAAEADATGWTLIQQGVATEAAPLVTADTVITPIYVEVIVP